MSAALRTRQPWRFAVFEFDPNTSELRKHGLLMKLPGQACQVLMALLERPGELVTRDELRSRIWSANTTVDFDHSIGTAVNRIREALGDSPATPRFIETVPRRGFRFIAHIEMAHPMAGNIEPPTPTPVRAGLSHKITVMVAGLALAAIVATTAYDSIARARDTVEMRTLAVLPLENLSRDPDQQFFVDGMTDELTTVLARCEPLRVIARTSVIPYKNKVLRVRDIGRDLKAGAVVEGSVLRVGSRVRITVQLIDARNEQHLWADSYEADHPNVMKLQSELALAIATQVQKRLDPARGGPR
ncbi:MAG: winged helix-turn-helix domain-containing protein [Bryobacteraceae bacterium]